MSYFPLTEAQAAWGDRAEAIGREVLAPRAAQTDREGAFPREQLDALREAGLFGLRLDRAQGGQGEGLLTTSLVVERLAAHCPSTALIYKMHVESTEMVARTATPEQADRLLPRIASGEWLSTVAASETRSGGAWAGAPKATVRQVDGGYEVAHIRKSFVTGAGIADLYFLTCALERPDEKPLPLIFHIHADDLEWTVDEPWDGLGMRGNASSPMTFSGFIPQARRLNPEGKPVDLMPVVLATYAATYLGIAAGCYRDVAQFVQDTHLADGRRMADVETIARRVAKMKVEVERSRALLYAAASAFDAGRHENVAPFFEAKIASDELAAFVTGEAMTIGGGAAYAKRLPFERYFRDARAGMVMGIAHDVALLSLARTLFPKPKAEGKTQA